MGAQGSDPGEVAPRAAPLHAGSLALALVHYEPLGTLGGGGMGTVLLARRREDGREVALKIPHAFVAEITPLREALLEEARVGALLRHPNVVAVLDAGHTEEGLYLAREYVEGATLSALAVAEGAPGLSLEVGMRILLDALAGLAAAHALPIAPGAAGGLAHGDVSPGNVLVGRDGVARLIDFSAAHGGGGLGGSAAYRAPERARGGPPDPRGDVWSAGVIAWEICAGRRLGDRRGAPPPPLAEVRPEAPRGLAEAIASALKAEPGARWPDAAALAEAVAAGCGAGGIRIATAGEVGAAVAARLAAGRAPREER